MQSLSLYRECLLANQAGLVPTYWLAVSLSNSNDNTPEISRVQEDTV